MMKGIERKLHVLYRISDKGFNAQKNKLSNATKQHCLMNASEEFGKENIFVFADNCSEELLNFIKSQGFIYEETHSSKGGSANFKRALNKAVNNYNDEDAVYLLEDDFLHLPGSRELMLEGLEIADYVTLYDHPDEYMKYDSVRVEEAPFNKNDFRRSRIYLTEHSHWREIPSTVMSFAATVKTFREDYDILIRQPDKGVTDSFRTFIRLTKRKSIYDFFLLLKLKHCSRKWKLKLALAVLMNNFAFFRKKRLLISCLPGRSTHCEIKWLSPLVDWTKV